MTINGVIYDFNIGFIYDCSVWVITKINEELSKISMWLKLNKLSLNIKKTHYMLFHVRQKN